MLTTPIKPVLYYDPVAAYQEIASTVPEGSCYVQNFDYSIIELPQCNDAKYLEKSFPNSPVIDADGDLGSWDIRQGSLGFCGTAAKIGCYMSFPNDSPWRAEVGIYPTTPSLIGLYLVRVCDPSDPAGTAWVAIDSKMPCKIDPTSYSVCMWLKDGQPLLPALLAKAAATMRGGGFNELTNSAQFKITFEWFPFKKVRSPYYSIISKAIQSGAICVFAMSQQYDDAGAKITPPGVVYGHAFGLVGAIAGSGFELFRIQNPWGGGKEYVSQYSDDAQFWIEHPELAQQAADSKSSEGNYWVDFKTLKKIAGRTTFELIIPV
jgi:Calpain family cysteine protease